MKLFENLWRYLQHVDFPHWCFAVLIGSVPFIMGIVIGLSTTKPTVQVVSILRSISIQVFFRKRDLRPARGYFREWLATIRTLF